MKVKEVEERCLKYIYLWSWNIRDGKGEQKKTYDNGISLFWKSHVIEELKINQS